MLVLTRKQQQQIKIGDNITVTILRVKGSVVRVGVEAPGGVKILRGELTVDSTTPLGTSTAAGCSGSRPAGDGEDSADGGAENGAPWEARLEPLLQGGEPMRRPVELAEIW